MIRQKNTLMMFLLLSALAASCSTYDGAKAAVNLSGIDTPSNEKLAFSLYAVGTQTYRCQLRDGIPDWVGTPEADLYNDKGELIGKHKGGPTWEMIGGSSNVVGDAPQRKSKPAVGKAIDWLWLPAKPHSDSGMFGKVTSIQRINTVGGVGPKGPCDQEKDSKPVSVYYSATYYFNTTK